jgi:hypothetical protein
MTATPAGLTPTLSLFPFGGTAMSQRQSSVTSLTQ